MPKVTPSVWRWRKPFVVEVRDGNDLVFEGVPVVFTITAGGGIVQPEITTTDANGLAAKHTLTLGSDPGTNTVDGRRRRNRPNSGL